MSVPERSARSVRPCIVWCLPYLSVATALVSQETVGEGYEKEGDHARSHGLRADPISAACRQRPGLFEKVAKTLNEADSVGVANKGWTAYGKASFTWLLASSDPCWVSDLNPLPNRRAP